MYFKTYFLYVLNILYNILYCIFFLFIILFIRYSNIFKFCKHIIIEG